jgi:hypothetical protein
MGIGDCEKRDGLDFAASAQLAIIKIKTAIKGWIGKNQKRRKRKTALMGWIGKML